MPTQTGRIMLTHLGHFREFFIPQGAKLAIIYKFIALKLAGVCRRKQAFNITTKFKTIGFYGAGFNQLFNVFFLPITTAVLEQMQHRITGAVG